MEELDLTQLGSNMYSQSGEDEVVRAIFDRTGVKQGYFVEFGAWDGKFLSNTYLFYELGWRGIYIEGRRDRYQALKDNIGDDKVKTVCRYVRETGDDSLDNILSSNQAPKNVDLLSIDIDGDDLAIWRSVREHTATCVVIEYNPTIPIGVEFENEPGKNWGNSSTSVCKFANSENYELVAQTAHNLIFLRSSVLLENDIARCHLSPQNHLFVGYDGTLFQYVGGKTRNQPLYDIGWGHLIWQPYMRFLRGFDNTFKIAIRRIWQGIGMLISNPSSFLWGVKRYMGLSRNHDR